MRQPLLKIVNLARIVGIQTPSKGRSVPFMALNVRFHAGMMVIRSI